MITTRGGWLPPLAWTASMAARLAKAAYPSSAPPRPLEAVALPDRVHGPSPSRQPTISGCLSRWP